MNDVLQGNIKFRNCSASAIEDGFEGTTWRSSLPQGSHSESEDPELVVSMSQGMSENGVQCVQQLQLQNFAQNAV